MTGKTIEWRGTDPANYSDCADFESFILGYTLRDLDYHRRYKTMGIEPSRLAWEVATQACMKACGEAWIPIESAPTDGTEVDLFYKHLGRVTDCLFFNGMWQTIISDGTMRAVSIESPSHWRRKPNPPRETG